MRSLSFASCVQADHSLQPRDSKHPHRAMNVDAYQVKWLTDEEFQAAKQRCELSSQRGQPSDLSASVNNHLSLANISTDTLR